VLKVRVIPTLLWKGLGLVKGVAFNSWRRVGTVLPALKVYNSRDVDELVLLDISATDEQRAPEHESIADLSDECSVPLTVGGGITDLTQISALLRAGITVDQLEAHIPFVGALLKKEQDAEALQRFDAKSGRYPSSWKELGPRYNQ